MPAIPQWLIAVVGYLIALIAILRIVLQRREPTATLAWVLSILFLPYLGVLLYLLIGRHRLKRRVKQRHARAHEIQPELERLGAEIASSDPGTQPHDRLVRLAHRMDCRPPTFGNQVKLLHDADRKYLALEEAIRGATQHIHLLYYIFQPDDSGLRFRNLLCQKAKEGVQVRMLTDGVGSFGIDNFMVPLVEAGGEFAEFLPATRLMKPWKINLRNHRKIVVVDGTIGFTGGVNIGDEYTGRKRKVGYWRDTHLQLEGPSVTQLQEIFAEDWFFATGKQPMDESWFPTPKEAGPSMVQVIASGPDTDILPIQRMFFAAVTEAQHRILLTTPYFIPDESMIMALQTAALRDVDVKLLLPYRSDMSLVLHAGRSYYRELLRAGVRIFEYLPGILHAKTLVVDDFWATVGSANMDVRSFRLNFEVNAMVYGPAFNRHLADAFAKDLQTTREVTLADLDKKSPSRKMAEGMARMLSPVL
jgi:cardiolipin synthase A/B